MSRQHFRDVIRFFKGFISDRPMINDPSYASSRLDQVSGVDYAAPGSANVLFVGQAMGVPFKGLTLVSGIGGLQTVPIGGVPGTIGQKAADVPVGTLTFGNTFCTLGTSSVVSGGIQISGHVVSDQSITMFGTIEFNFTDTAASNHVSLINKPQRDCSSVWQGADVGWGIQSTSSGPTLALAATRATLGAAGVVDHTGVTITGSADVFKIVVNNGTVRYYKNGTSYATSATLATGTSLYLKVGAGTPIRITKFSNRAYV